MRNIALALALVASTVAHASEVGPANGADLRLSTLDTTDSVALGKAKRLRLAGIVTTVAGLAVITAGSVGFAYVNHDGEGVDNYNGFAGTAAVVIGGEATFGAGVGLAIAGGVEAGRIERGAAPIRRPRRLRDAGIALTLIGGALTATAIGLAILDTTCHNDCGDVGPLGSIFGMVTGVPASLFVASGTALLGIGVSEERRGQPRVVIDSIGPRAMPNGGGFGIGGRF